MGAQVSQVEMEKPSKEDPDVDPWTPPVYNFPDHVPIKSDDVHKSANERKMKIFYKELMEKRKQLSDVIAEKSDEMKKLRKLVNELTNRVQVLEDENKELKNEAPNVEGNSNDDIKLEEATQLQIQTTKLLQNVQNELLQVIEERNNLKKNIDKYKKISEHTKSMLQIRDDELAQLRSKMADIESSLEKFQSNESSENENMRLEYEKQLQNIKKLKILYDKRAADMDSKQIANEKQISELKTLLEDQSKKSKDLEIQVNDLNTQMIEKQNALADLEYKLDLSKGETNKCQQELLVINKIFSQALMGTNKKDEIDIDQLVIFLDQNRDLISDLTTSESEETSAMQQVLCDLMQVNQLRKNAENQESVQKTEEKCGNDDTVDKSVSQSDDKSLENSVNENNTSTKPDSSLQDSKITDVLPDVSKLLKLWRVLVELLTYQNGRVKTQEVPDVEQNNGAVPKKRGSACYKSIQTPAGPKLVLSVSKTYIRLKDLILEKKALQKEMTRLNQLYAYIEARFSSQQRRLANVSSELSHTWCLAGRMQKSYKTLHSHEQILRYELKQKRKMLNGLKQELQLCREKWQQAKEKNTESEVEWKRLRSEFASRKLPNQTDDCCSAESGFSDERSDDSDIETKEIVTEQISNDISKDTLENNAPIGNITLPTEENIAAVPNLIEEQVVSGNMVNEIVQLESDEIPNKEDHPSSQDSAESKDDVSEPSTSINTENRVPDQSTNVPNNIETSTTNKQTPAEILSSRDARLRQMEEQCKQLVNKVTKTSHRSKELCCRLEELHEQYGRDDQASGSRETEKNGKEDEDKTTE